MSFFVLNMFYEYSIGFLESGVILFIHKIRLLKCEHFPSERVDRLAGVILVLISLI